MLSCPFSISETLYRFNEECGELWYDYEDHDRQADGISKEDYERESYNADKLHRKWWSSLSSSKRKEFVKEHIQKLDRELKRWIEHLEEENDY